MSRTGAPSLHEIDRFADQRCAGVCFLDEARERPFESIYLALRRREGRLMSDEEVARLPDMARGHVHREEWRMRADSIGRFLRYLARSGPQRVLEVGCGCGWFANAMARLDNTAVVGLDINRHELYQAARVFGARDNLRFCCGELSGEILPARHFTMAVLASSAQYFADLSALIERLGQLIVPGGEIHVFDTPLYDPGEVAAARARSARYFEEMGFPAMRDAYFHHSVALLRQYRHSVIYDPESRWNRVRRRLRPASPFPWVRIDVPEPLDGG